MAVLIIVLVLFFGISYVKAPPDTAFIITGLRKQMTLIGKAGFRIPGLERIDKIPFNLIQVDIKTASAVPTKKFINIFVDGVLARVIREINESDRLNVWEKYVNNESVNRKKIKECIVITSLK